MFLFATCTSAICQCSISFSCDIDSALSVSVSCNGLAFTGPIVLFESSPSRSANLKAVAELKFMPAAINQSTLVIKYNPLTDNIAPFSILMASTAKLTVGDSVSSDHSCICAMEKVWVSTTLESSCLDVAPLDWCSSSLISYPI